MNGTDLPTVNIYASCGAPLREAVGVYSYPRDLDTVTDAMAVVQEHRRGVTSDLASQGFHLGDDANLVPIYAHRYVVCTADLTSSVVLSVVVDHVDAIVYGNSLQEYLIKEFLTPGLLTGCLQQLRRDSLHRPLQSPSETTLNTRRFRFLAKPLKEVFDGPVVLGLRMAQVTEKLVLQFIERHQMRDTVRLSRSGIPISG